MARKKCEACGKSHYTELRARLCREQAPTDDHAAHVAAHAEMIGLLNPSSDAVGGTQ